MIEVFEPLERVSEVIAPRATRGALELPAAVLEVMIPRVILEGLGSSALDGRGLPSVFLEVRTPRR